MIERVLRFSLARRQFVFLATAVLALAGVHAASVLPIDAVPDITNNQVQINAENAALSPTEIEKQVTFPIETALAGVPGLDHTRSLSRNGFAQVTAIFRDDVDVYFARQQILERLTEIRASLPAGTEPTMGPIATGLGEVAMWVIRYSPRVGEHAPDASVHGAPGLQPDGSYVTPEGERLATGLERAAYLRTVQDWIVRPQLKNVAGVAGIDSIGGFVKQFHVQPDPALLVAHGLSFHDLVEALEANNVSAGAGTIESNGEAWVVRATGRIQRIDEIESILVRTRNGVPIFVRDVAWVGIGPEMRTGSATEAGEEVVVGTALMRIGENSRTVARAVTAALADVAKRLPADVEVRTVLDRTDLVDATIRTVAKNLAEGAILVIVVLFALLGNFRAAFLTALAIPLSMLLTAIGMVESRISGNLMSLGAIDFGLLVDGSVIIVENALRLLAERQQHLGRALTLRERLEVTLTASKQVLGPAVFGGAIIVTVYVPILFLTGVEGKMFRPMALTVIFALVAAFVIALTFVPAIAATALSGRIRERENPLVRVARRAYEPSLAMALRFRGLVIAAAVLVFAGSIVLFTRLGQEFAPTLAELDFAIHAIRIPSTSLTESTAMQRDVEKAIQRVPEVAFAFSKTGTAEMASDPMPPNVSDTFVVLKPRHDWPTPSATKAEVGARIEAELTQLIGNNYEFTQPIEMRFNELIAGVRGDVAVKVFGDDLERLLPVAQRIAAELSATPGAADVRVEQVSGLPLLSIDADRHALARYGLSVADVQEVASIAVGGREAGQVFEGDRRFDLVVRLPESFRHDLTALASLPIPLAHDDADAAGEGDAQPAFLPLSELAELVLTEGPNQISRENGKRRIVVQANVTGRDLGSFVADAAARIDANVEIAPGSWIEWGGQFENLTAAKKRLTIVVPLCFGLIFALLYASLGSARDAVLVFSGVPLALSGGVLSLWLRQMPFSISSAVGFIALSGIAVLNGLVMVTFIQQLRAEGLPLVEAIQRGAVTRLRPVLMTALVASLGFVPMMLATGTGAEVQRPVATVVVGGLVTSTALTLLVLPALYRVAARPDAVQGDPT